MEAAFAARALERVIGPTGFPTAGASATNLKIDAFRFNSIAYKKVLRKN